MLECSPVYKTSNTMTIIDNLANSGWVLLLLAAVIGACFGSFITLLAHRLPRDEPVVATRSRCPQCHTPLRSRDLVPVLSYLWSRGQCRHCALRISPRYLMIELVTAVCFVLLVWQFGLSTQAGILVLLAVCLIALIVIDFEHYIIPDSLQVAMIVLGVAYCFVMERVIDVYIVGALVGLLIGLVLRYGFLWLRNKDALGMGDVKFLFVVGLWLGAKPLVPFLFIAGLLGIATSLLWRALRQGALFPFGPALAIAMVICLLWPELPALFWQADRWVGVFR